MLQFVQTNWLALLSLVIALVGGVRGLIDIANEMRSHPRMSAYLRHLTPISTQDTSGRPCVGLILELTIGNRGRDALVPLAFQLKCKIGDKWLPFTRGTVPEGFALNLNGSIQKFNNVEETDIGRFAHAIKRENPAIGFLVFSTTSRGL